MSHRHPHAPLPYALRLVAGWALVWLIAFAIITCLVVGIGAGTIR